MSRDFSRIAKEINDSHKEFHDAQNNPLEQDISGIKKDIASLKKNIEEINTKVDELIDIMGNLTIMFFDEEEIEDGDDIYDTDQTWVPEEDDWTDNY